MNIVDQYNNSMLNPFSGTSYYFLSLKNNSRNATLGIFTRYISWADEKATTEFRKISTVDPLGVKHNLQMLDKSFSIVNSAEELTAFIAIGGYSLIEKNIFEIHLEELTQPIQCSNVEAKGFIHYSSLPSINKARFARDKLRAYILNRDDLRCRVCGISPDDNIHVRLEVHHIKPWEQGGLTIEENLITLCNSCHMGANKFDRFKLYEKIGLNFPYTNSTFFSPTLHTSIDKQRLCVYLASNTLEINAPIKKFMS